MPKKRLALALALATIIGWFGLAATARIGSQGRAGPTPTAGISDATVEMHPFSERTCGDGFAAHPLEHVTQASDAPARLFDSNGSGVAAEDLDDNGFADIVLGNLEGPNTILWNEGGWQFTPETMQDRSTRAVNLVDVDADGRLDIVTTHRGSGVAVFRNAGDRTFEQLPLRGVNAPAYSMSWGDIDGDGDLDLATGSYDAELDQRLRSSFLFNDGAGVFVYDNLGGGSFEALRLAEDSQALATALIDLDLDGRLDLLVGNDFEMPDMTWLHTSRSGLVEAHPFEFTSAHTMSLDAGDIDNDGVEEIFGTDMRPASSDTDVMAEWLPLMETMDDTDDPFDPQRIRNVLQANRGDGTFDEVGERAGIDAAGWAWSGRFGDLDNDGDNDLYVVNGMIAAETFWYLDGAEIREPNMAYSNRGDGTFALADWGLGGLESGRGSTLVDLDNDGRLDVVVNNLAAPSVAYENRLCGAGDAVSFSLSQPGTANTSAIGAEVRLQTASGLQVRTVRSGAGYLSGSPMTLHFGIAAGDELLSALVRWPDGKTTVIEGPLPGHRHLVIRS